VSKRRILQSGLIVLLTGLAAGCGASRPVKYYVLDAGPAPSSTASAPIPITLLVGRIVTSHLYRDDRLVFGSGPVQLGTYEYNRWAESPADMIQDLLINYLRSTGQYRSVARIASNIRGDYIVRGNLYALYEVDRPALLARFSFQLELFDPKTRTTVWSDSYSHDEPVHGKAVAEVVEAMDRNVKGGMQQLTANMGQYFAAHPPEPQAAK
jgi:ABC-type uncharacterized transport system auxiliary subunit